MKRAVFAAVSTAFVLASAAPTWAAANLVTNGGFENQPGFTGNPYDYGLSPTDWTTNSAWNSNSANAVAGAAFGAPHSGSDSVRFGASNSGDATTLSQTISDLVGMSYKVMFYTYADYGKGVNGNGVSNGTPLPGNDLTASIGGQSVALPDTVADNSSDPFYGCINNSKACWVPESFSFTGTGLDTLTFSTRSDYGYWHLDDISITQSVIAGVPEPASWAMMIVGLGMLGLGMRLRQRRRVLNYI